jgi:hypothetical protein
LLCSENTAWCDWEASAEWTHRSVSSRASSPWKTATELPVARRTDAQRICVSAQDLGCGPLNLAQSSCC